MDAPTQLQSAQMRLQCPACDQPMVVSFQLAGKKVKCPKCGNMVLSQAAPTPPPIPQLGSIAASNNPLPRNRSASRKPLLLMLGINAFVFVVAVAVGVAIIAFLNKGERAGTKAPEQKPKENESQSDRLSQVLSTTSEPSKVAPENTPKAAEPTATVEKSPDRCALCESALKSVLELPETDAERRELKLFALTSLGKSALILPDDETFLKCKAEIERLSGADSSWVRPQESIAKAYADAGYYDDAKQLAGTFRPIDRVEVLSHLYVQVTRRGHWEEAKATLNEIGEIMRRLQGQDAAKATRHLLVAKVQTDSPAELVAQTPQLRSSLGNSWVDRAFADGVMQGMLRVDTVSASEIADGIRVLEGCDSSDLIVQTAWIVAATKQMTVVPADFARQANRYEQMQGWPVGKLRMMEALARYHVTNNQPVPEALVNRARKVADEAGLDRQMKTTAAKHLACILVYANQLENAEQLVATVSREDDRIQTMSCQCAVGIACARVGSRLGFNGREKAKEMFGRAMDGVRTFDAALDALAFEALVVEWFRSDSTNVLVLIDILRAVGERPGNTRTVAYLGLVKGLAEEALAQRSITPQKRLHWSKPSIGVEVNTATASDLSRTGLVSVQQDKAYLIATRRIPIEDGIHLVLGAGFVTDPAAPASQRGALFGVMIVCNKGPAGKLSRRTVLTITCNNLKVPFEDPQYKDVEADPAYRGVTETVEYANLDPYFMVKMLENIETLKVSVGTGVTVDLPEFEVNHVRAFYREVVDRCDELGFSLLNMSGDIVKSPSQTSAIIAKTHVPVEAVCDQGRGTTFNTKGQSGAELVGIEVTTAKFGKGFKWTAIGAIRPLFREGGKTTAGRWCGTPHGKTTRIEAQSAHSISSIEVSTGGRIMAVNVHFSGHGESAARSKYSSGWIGQKVDEITTLTCEPGDCAGLFGSWGKENAGQWPTTIRSLGLLESSE